MKTENIPNDKNKEGSESGKKKQNGSHQQQDNQPTLKKIRRVWNKFEIQLIKAADASKIDPRKNNIANSTESRHQEVILKSTELIKTRVELRNLLNEAEANVKDNAKEFKALNLMSKSSGYCIGRGRKRRQKPST